MAYDPNDAADKVIVDGLIAEATTRLQAKNTELIGEIRDLRKNGDGALQVKVDNLERQNEDLTTKLSVAKSEAATVKGDLTKTTAKLTTAQKRANDLLVKNELKDSLDANNVAPQFRKAVEAMFSSQATIKEDGDTVSILVGDKPLAEAIKTFAQSDEGKHFVAAQRNNGGGATPPGSGGNGKTVTREAFNAMDLEQQGITARDRTITIVDS